MTVPSSGRGNWPVDCSIGDRGDLVRYLFAWLLGVPFGIVALWFLFSNACAR